MYPSYPKAPCKEAHISFFECESVSFSTERKPITKTDSHVTEASQTQ
jgi:hypothetical protein